MNSILPGITILGLVALAAAWLTVSRSSEGRDWHDRRAASFALAAATGIQCVHFVEEWVTSFHVSFPALLGLDPLPLSFFVSFNVVWISLWLASIRLLRDGVKAAFFCAWFLALAGILNSVAHPAMAFISGGYFPGLVTSPFIGIAAALLLKRLYLATAPRPRAGY